MTKTQSMVTLKIIQDSQSIIRTPNGGVPIQSHAEVRLKAYPIAYIGQTFTAKEASLSTTICTTRVWAWMWTTKNMNKSK